MIALVDNLVELVDNPVELVGLIEPIGGLPEGVCGTRGLVIPNRPTNLSTKQSTISGGCRSYQIGPS